MNKFKFFQTLKSNFTTDCADYTIFLDSFGHVSVISLNQITAYEQVYNLKIYLRRDFGKFVFYHDTERGRDVLCTGTKTYCWYFLLGYIEETIRLGELAALTY